MLILPAIDLYEGQAVRLLKGDYAKKTVYSDEPVKVALKMKSEGAEALHIVDLQGAAAGTTPNFELICAIRKESGLFCEVGGGIRSLQTVASYIENGIDRVILGSAAVTDPEFLKDALKRYGEKIAVSVDLREGKVAIHGWKETGDLSAEECFRKLQALGVKTVICTDISRDGAMRGTNLRLYRELSERYTVDLVASGGVSSLEDVIRLREMDLYGAIIGKAYYTGDISLKDALEAAKC